MTSALYNTIGSLRQGVFVSPTYMPPTPTDPDHRGRLVGENMPVISPDHIEK